ncbi:MAG: hypothetical protein OEM52_03765 [bacterium]|nr:hypothetical protein [bacterium]
MSNTVKSAIVFGLILGGLLLLDCKQPPAAVERPVPIVSKRITYYDQATYQKLTELWQKYYKAFPSEDSYGNWMKAARYANHPEYEKLLAKGLKKYPSNPTLLYLSGMIRAGIGEPEATAKVERAMQLDPSFTDPIFALVVNYMALGEREKSDAMLRRLIELGAVNEEVMDYSYNMLAQLEPNAILITNGDNDTYPGWILTRIEKFRPDVVLVNRSLMNTTWYPEIVAKDIGLPFVTTQQITDIRNFRDQQTKAKTRQPGAGMYADTLIARIIESAKSSDRPLYFAITMMNSPELAKYSENGVFIGLSTLVTPCSNRETVATALADDFPKIFRTNGLDSWRMKHVKESDAGKMLLKNYARVIAHFVSSDHSIATEKKLTLFQWYRAHAEPLLSLDEQKEFGAIWKKWSELPEVKTWLTGLNIP